MLQKNQLRWACRRGMLELDRFLLSFVEDCFDHLSPAEQECFTLLLEEEDQDLSNWLLNVTPAAPQFQTLCDKIRNHAQQTF